MPVITELAQLDASGKERLAWLAMTVVGVHDFSNDPASRRRWREGLLLGRVYFRREFEPYMTLAIAGTRRDAGG